MIWLAILVVAAVIGAICWPTYWLVQDGGWYWSQADVWVQDRRLATRISRFRDAVQIRETQARWWPAAEVVPY